MYIYTWISPSNSLPTHLDNSNWLVRFLWHKQRDTVQQVVAFCHINHLKHLIPSIKWSAFIYIWRINTFPENRMNKTRSNRESQNREQNYQSQYSYITPPHYPTCCIIEEVTIGLTLEGFWGRREAWRGILCWFRIFDTVESAYYKNHR